MLTGRVLTRVGLLAGAIVIVTLILVLGFGIGRNRYTVTAEFTDAGQLVKGGTVQIGGRVVGSIASIELSNDGLAAVKMKFNDSSVTPLHVGTQAQIRTLGLSGVANRYVDLLPGPASSPEIPDGGRIDLNATTGIVDLDEVLTALDPTTRKRIESLVHDGGKLFPGDTAKQANQALHYVNPAFSEARALTGQLTADKHALATLIGTGSMTARTLAQHDAALGSLLDGSAGTLQALADENAATSDILAKAPAQIARMRASLGQIGGTFEGLKPTLKSVSAASPALVGLLNELPRSTRAVRPVLANLRRTLPSLNRTLRKLPGLERVTKPSLGSATSAIGQATPIFRGLRPYALDLVSGLFLGFGGTAGNSYDANGHLARIAITTGGAAVTGLASTVTSGGTVGTLDPQTGLFGRCPGAAGVITADKSNDFVEDPSTCRTGDRREP